MYFFSLEAANWLAVKGARSVYHLPYWYANMDMQNDKTTIEFESKRLKNPEIGLTCSYKPISEPYHATKGSFEEWLVERYCFYTLNSSGVPLRCEILHEPWSIQKAEADFQYNTILSKQGIETKHNEPILHFAKKIEVRAWPLVHHATNRLSI